MPSVVSCRRDALMASKILQSAALPSVSIVYHNLHTFLVPI